MSPNAMDTQQRSTVPDRGIGFRRNPFVLLAGLIAGVMLSGLAVVAQDEGQVVLAVEDIEEYGPILVDGEGFVVYAFLGDQREEGEVLTSTCDVACAENWPPLTVPSWPISEEVVGSEVDVATIDRIELEDGTYHLAYGGWPLYRYAGDDKPGTASGQGLGDNWYVVSADGVLVGYSDPDDGGSEIDTPEEAGDELATLMDEGASVFSRTCGNCHGREGEGESGLGPRLDGHPQLGNTDFLVNIILRGFGEMPPQGPLLSDREVAAVATYVRNSWSNDFGVVTEEEVLSRR